MVYLNVWIRVNRMEDVPTVRELLTAATHLSRQEPGCERYEAYHSQSDPQRFLLVERWATKIDWEQHRLAEAYTTVYAPKVIPLVTREAHPSDLLA